MVNTIFTRILFVVILILVIGGPIYLYLEKENKPVEDLFLPGTPIVRIENIAMKVEIAQTLEERKRGLSGRSAFDTADGLLFVFPVADYHGIWMKDVNFPIDIIWIGEDRTIIGIEKNVEPSTYPTIFRPQQPARYVIETNVHYADTFDLHPGQKVELPEEYIAK